jgi:hypothetical protein
MNNNFLFMESLRKNYVMMQVRRYKPDRFISPTPVKIKGYELVNDKWAVWMHGDGFWSYYELKHETYNVGAHTIKTLITEEGPV